MFGTRSGPRSAVQQVAAHPTPRNHAERSSRTESYGLADLKMAPMTDPIATLGITSVSPHQRFERGARLQAEPCMAGARESAHRLPH
jgi:hypothetical protein